MDNITIKEYELQREKTPMVNTAILAIFIIIIIGLFAFFVTKFTNEAFPILVFIILMFIPVLVVFKDDLPKYVPPFLRKFIISDDPPKPKRIVRNVPTKKTTTKKMQNYFIIAMSIITIIIGALIYLIKTSLRPEITAAESINQKALLKIIAALFLTCILGVLALKFDKYNSTSI